MDTTTLLASIDEEIALLQQVKQLLTGSGGMKSRVGRPPATAFTYGANRPRKKRVLSAEARARIAAAQRKRWAKQKAAK